MVHEELASGVMMIQEAMLMDTYCARTKPQDHKLRAQHSWPANREAPTMLQGSGNPKP